MSKRGHYRRHLPSLYERKPTMMERFVQFSMATTLAVMMCALLFAWWEMSLPIMQRDAASGECVKVTPPYTCQQPPRKYETVWIAPQQFRSSSIYFQRRKEVLI